MAKNDNLTDFLRGIAERLRALLGTADLIDPQDFENKIQGVYDKGFSEGGPTGITATAPDVLTGKVFGSGGNTKSTGTMPKRASVSTASAVSYDGVRVTGRFPNGYYPNYDSSGAALYLPNANVASAIGLTAAKLVQGQSVLGITGTGFTQPFYVGYNLYPTYGTFHAGKAPYTAARRTIPAPWRSRRRRKTPSNTQTPDGDTTICGLRRSDPPR